MTAQIAQKEGNWVLTVPKQMLSDEFFKRLTEWVDYLNLVQQSQLTEGQAWELSESLKESWWKANRERMLQKIGQV